MFYGFYSICYGSIHPFISMSMGSYFETVIRCCFCDCCKFFISKLWILTTFRNAKYSSSSGDLNPIRSIFVALTYCFFSIIHRIDHTLFGSWIPLKIIFKTVSWISMSSCGTNGFSRRKNSRSRHFSFVYCIPQGNIDSTSSHISNCSKASHQCPISDFSSFVGRISGIVLKYF